MGCRIQNREEIWCKGCSDNKLSVHWDRKGGIIMLTQSECAQIFAMRLAQALNDAKLTAFDISVSPIYLKGEILPSLDEIIRIAKKLGVTAEWLSGLDYVYQKKENEKESSNELMTKCRIIIRQFVDNISETINQSDADTLTADDIKLLELITACRNKLTDVHNKIGDPEWKMPDWTLRM